jgi:hypothetical protein
MKQASHNDLIIFYHEVDSVGESSEQAPPEFVVNFSRKEGMMRDITSAGIEHPKEFIAKSRRLRFVPGKAADSIIFDFRQKTKSTGHLLFSILTRRSSRERRAPGADTYRLRRASSSALWLSGMGIDVSSAEILSQRSSTNNIFSGVLNFEISERSFTRMWHLLHYHPYPIILLPNIQRSCKFDINPFSYRYSWQF